MSEAKIYESSQNFSVIMNLTDKITTNKNEVEIKLHLIPSVINDTTFKKNFNSP